MKGIMMDRAEAKRRGILGALSPSTAPASLAGEALQKPTSKREGDAAARILRDPSRSKRAKTAAGLALTQHR